MCPASRNYSSCDPSFPIASFGPNPKFHSTHTVLHLHPLPCLRLLCIACPHSVSRDKAGGAEIGCAEDFPACSISQISTFGMNTEGKVCFAHQSLYSKVAALHSEQLCPDAPKAKELQSCSPLRLPAARSSPLGS